MANGTEIHQWQYLAKKSQKWIFEHQGDGYYTIRSANSNGAYYLGVEGDSNTQNSNIVLRTGTITDGMKWSVSVTTSGAYRLTPKTGDWCLATNTSDQTNGVKLIAGEYVYNNSYRDEWELIQIKYIYNVEHYYDQGYDVRFTDAAENMREYQEVCSKILLGVFGIKVNFNIQDYTSCSDTCTGVPTTLGDTTTSCGHSNVDHKTSDNIRSNLISQFGNGTSVLSRVAWTGHVLESRRSNSSSPSHTVVISIGNVTDNSNKNLPSDTIRYRRIYTLLHELSHQLGAPDHYCYDDIAGSTGNCNNSSGDCWICDLELSEEPYCVMSSLMVKDEVDLEEIFSNGTIGSIYCDQCMSSTHPKGILTHLNDHHYDN